MDGRRTAPLSFLPITQQEELMLIDMFGTEYIAYMNRTGPCLPPIRKTN
jgi:protein-S-isoprenylcysteine O-methyltransferase Ste14